MVFLLPFDGKLLKIIGYILVICFFLFNFWENFFFRAGTG